LNGDRFVLGLKGCKYDFVCDGQWTRVAENSSDLLTGDWYDESLIAASKNTDYPSINVSPGYINGYKILASDLCTGGRQTWRLMTMKDQAYQLVYLQHEDRPDIMKIGISKAFESMKAAIADTSKIVLNNCIKLYSKKRSSSTPAALSDWQKSWSDDIYDFRISDDNKRILYQGKWWGIEQVEQVQTNLPVPLYRLALQIGKEMTAIYLMPVNSSELLLSTETNLPVEGSQVLISSIGTFHKLTLKSGEVNLPQSLNEIWHGGTSNRLININLAKTTLYYSTGDKKTYGTYRIDETMNTGKLTRIITRAGNEYQVFFLRNIQAYSFELSVCQNRYKSKAEARLINESYCDKFNRMTLHYEQDSSKIFLPFNPAMMEAGNRQKIDRLLSETGNPANQSIAGQTTGTLYYNSSFGWEIPDRMPIQITRTVKLTSETPFDRSYVQYEIKRPSDKFSISNNFLYFYGKQVNYMATPNSGANYVPEYIVIHSSASTSAKGTINWFLNPQSKAATHILIDRDGNITQFAPFNKVVYHAGASEWDGKSGLNRYSIGIDLINAGSLTRKGKDWVNVAGQIVPGNEVDIIKGKEGENESAWHNYTREQINTLSEICKVLRETYSIQAVLGHSEISPNKKADPGPAFPLEKFK
jgi:N-acetylmuramoyl-L-alanine amidase